MEHNQLTEFRKCEWTGRIRQIVFCSERLDSGACIGYEADWRHLVLEEVSIKQRVGDGYDVI